MCGEQNQPDLSSLSLSLSLALALFFGAGFCVELHIPLQGTGLHQEPALHGDGRTPPQDTPPLITRDASKMCVCVCVCVCAYACRYVCAPVDVAPPSPRPVATHSAPRFHASDERAQQALRGVCDSWAAQSAHSTVCAIYAAAAPPPVSARSAQDGSLLLVASHNLQSALVSAAARGCIRPDAPRLRAGAAAAVRMTRRRDWRRGVCPRGSCPAC